MLKFISLTYRLWKRKREDRVKRLYRKDAPSKNNQLKQELGL